MHKRPALTPDAHVCSILFHTVRKMPLDKDLSRRLRIHTGSVTRLSKELAQYTADQESAEARIRQMKTANADPYDLKHAVSGEC